MASSAPVSVLDTIVSRIDRAGLPHPSGALLECFVRESMNPAQAGQYLALRLDAGQAAEVVEDWKYIVGCPLRESDRAEIARRDGHRCCITGNTGTSRDPLSVVPILVTPFGWNTEKRDIMEMLGAFFGPQYRDWWLTEVTRVGMLRPHQDHWLVQKSAAAAFAAGRVRLNRLQQSMIEYEARDVLMGPEDPLPMQGKFPLLGDHSRSGIQKVDPRFVGTAARMSKSIRLLELSDTLAQDATPQHPQHSSQPSPSPQTCPSTTSNTWAPGFALRCWLSCPSRLRLFVYQVLQRIGKRLYGTPQDMATVQRLPFGLYLKYNREPDEALNEHAALNLASLHTSIPVPRPIDVIIEPPAPRQPGTETAPLLDAPSSSDAFVVITRLPGFPLWQCQELLADRDCEAIVLQLAHYMTELRAIPRSPASSSPTTGKDSPSTLICSATGGPVRDPRVRGGQAVGPCSDEASFNQNMRFPNDPTRQGHGIVFTHADLNPRNILVDRCVRDDGTRGWTVTGIVDWETAGWFPEYWDCTKAQFEGFRWTRRYNRMMRKVFEGFGGYAAELEIERRSWESGDGV
ncbi:hypothetical protein Micbo1qcDRAFT_190271 [Microdochium bolleyi]|uniref:Aminoglycoside phosphotransferase domain-containing protein n=1 Tax=Microdochium bolleyi TaxID=196109 RepID=A0A136IQN0_9PEZI|nr:hypothetical protein Micbo1qcDRAFT_190271 [Microdochium bolleyi]